MTQLFSRRRRSRVRSRLHPVASFQRAHAYWHFRAFDQAIPLLEDMVLEHPKHSVTELGGALLLDSLSSTGRLRELRMWLDLFIHIDGLLENKPQLRAIVRDYRQRHSTGKQASRPRINSEGARLLASSSRGEVLGEQTSPVNEND